MDVIGGEQLRLRPFLARASSGTHVMHKHVHEHVQEHEYEHEPAAAGSWLLAFSLIYFTFFLDNVLLTVLVPIIPDWISGEAASAWAGAGNASRAEGAGAAPAVLGLVLSCKAGAQLACCAPAAAAVARAGPAPALRAGAALLLAAALALAALAAAAPRAQAAALGAAAARAAHGAGAALTGVGGMALAARVAPLHVRRAALSALLGAVALGVLVGYPFGGATAALRFRGAPFLLIAVALIIDLLLQYRFLDKEEYNRGWAGGGGARAGAGGALALVRGAGRGAGGAGAGAVLLTTAVMAALEPCLPLWLAERFHPARWVGGAVFVPDSLAYLVSASALGAGAGGARRAAALGVGGVAAVGAAALGLPLARTARGLAAPHALLGLGLGATDAALVPALLAGAPRRSAARAALVSAAGSAAYVLGPVLGGAGSWLFSFPTTLRALGVANLLYAVYLHRTLQRHPLHEEWDESEDDEDDESPKLNTYSSLDR